MISVIIPTFNEEQALPGTLRALLSQPGDYEVIVVDGGSVDRTWAVAESFGFAAPGEIENLKFKIKNVGWQVPHIQNLIRLSAKRGRASQMNAGAKQAGGDWLLFLHADTLLPEGADRRADLPEVLSIAVALLDRRVEPHESGLLSDSRLAFNRPRGSRCGRAARVESA